MIDQVAVIGVGQMATVCAILLADKGIPVRMWGARRESVEALKSTRENRRHLPGVQFPDRVSFTPDAAAALDGADLVVSAIPCQYLREVWQQIGKHHPEGVPICSVSKGIETGTLLRPTQIITNVIDTVPMIALSGPTIARELARCLPASVVAACEDIDLGHRVQEAFATPWLRVYTNTDLTGVELAGATKNVIAIAAGILDGLRAGDNAKASLLSRGLAEITRLGLVLGAHRETFAGLAGLGDLVTTCASPMSRNRTAGEHIGQGQKVQAVIDSTTSVIEGIPTTRSVCQLASELRVDMPITEAVYTVLFEDRDALDALTELMSRELKDEV